MLIYCDNEVNKNRKYKHKLNSHVVVKAKNHLELKEKFKENSKYKVPRNIINDIAIIENENAKGYVYKTKVRYTIIQKCFEIMWEKSEIFRKHFEFDNDEFEKIKKDGGYSKEADK